MVAIARKMLVVWHLLSEDSTDRFLNPEQVAFAFFYNMEAGNMPPGTRALAYTRQQMDRLRIGEGVAGYPLGRKRYKLPTSELPPEPSPQLVAA